MIVEIVLLDLDRTISLLLPLGKKKGVKNFKETEKVTKTLEEIKIKMVRMYLISNIMTLETLDVLKTTLDVLKTIIKTSAPEEAMETMDAEITKAVLLSTITFNLVNSSVLNTIVHHKIVDANNVKIRSRNAALCTTQTPVVVAAKSAKKELLN